jgi:hypothetical protein
MATTLTETQYKRLYEAHQLLDTLADELGDEWDDYEFDHLANARSLIREWIGSHGRHGLDG